MLQFPHTDGSQGFSCVNLLCALQSELPMSSVGPSPAVLPQSPSTSYRTLKLFTTSSPELDEAAEAAQTAVPFRSPNNSNKSLKLYATASAGMDESVEPTMPYKSPTTSHKSLKLYDSASATIDEAAEVAEAERIRYRASVSPTPRTLPTGPLLCLFLCHRVGSPESTRWQSVGRIYLPAPAPRPSPDVQGGGFAPFSD